MTIIHQLINQIAWSVKVYDLESLFLTIQNSSIPIVANSISIYNASNEQYLKKTMKITHPVKFQIWIFLMKMKRLDAFSTVLKNTIRISTTLCILHFLYYS